MKCHSSMYKYERKRERERASARERAWESERERAREREKSQTNQFFIKRMTRKFCFVRKSDWRKNGVMCIIGRSPTNTVDAITTLVIIHLKESQNCMWLRNRFPHKYKSQFSVCATPDLLYSHDRRVDINAVNHFSITTDFQPYYYYNNHQAIQWGQMLCFHIIRARRFYCYTKPIEKGLVYVMKVQL